MHPSDSDTLPDYETARKIVEMNALIESTTDPKHLAWIAEMTLQDADDFADDATKELMVDAIFGEQNLGGAW
jgi:hypothetical protein